MILTISAKLIPMNHYSYLKYLLRHKWFVFLACRKLRVSIFLAIFHDWSKFLPSEWFPYVHTFYNSDGSKTYRETSEFTTAWNHHQKRNKHHWQYWLVTFDRGETIAVEMPYKYIVEMVADWVGAGMAISGRSSPLEWYKKNIENIKLHPSTRLIVEKLIEA